MKTFKKNNLTYINALLLFTVLSIPFYQFRIPIFSTSLSVLTLSLCVLAITLFLKVKNDLFLRTKDHYIFSVSSALFIGSFLLSLILWPTLHSAGVFIEWILIPAITGFLLYVYLQKNTSAYRIILFGFTVTLFFVSIISLFFFFSGYLTYDHRLSAFFLSPNHLAMLLAPLLFTSYAYSIREKSSFTQLIIFLSLGLGSVTIILTQSLTTVIAVCVTIIICIMILSKRKFIFFAGSLLIIFLIGVFSYGKLITSNDVFERNSFSSRIMIWENTIYHIQKSPLLGYQIDNFQDMYLKTQPLFTPYLEWAVPTPHNLILTLWLSGGFFGVFFFCTLIAYILFCGFTVYFTKKERHILFYCAALIVIVLTSVFDTPYWKNDLAIIFWMISGLIMSAAPSPRSRKG